MQDQSTTASDLVQRGNLPLKRALDVTMAGLGLIITSPVMLLCGALVKLSSRGPVFFGHRRCAEGGREFRCLKFRTMVNDAEAWLERDPQLEQRHRANGFKLPPADDPRITAVGRWLRFTHLDELPQLINVLRGDMSLVGPRPIVVAELSLYGDRAGEFLARRPGIFGPWTALGRRRPGYPRRTDVELSYPLRPTLVDDLGILARNVPALLTGQSDEQG